MTNRLSFAIIYRIMSAFSSNENERQPLHEPLSDERLGELLAAVDNHEGKALLVMLMQQGVYYRQQELHNLLTNLPGASGVNIGHRTNQIGYCKESLRPVGMVTKADFGEVLRFGISEDGERLGKPLAVGSLQVMSAHALTRERDISLEQLWGATHSPTEKRSPLVRFLAIEALLTSPNETATVGQLAEALHEDYNLLSIPLLMLSKHGLVEYKTWEIGRDKVVYSVPDPSKIHHTEGRPRGVWTEAAVQYLLQHKKGTLDELAAYSWESAPQEEKRDNSLEEVRHKLAVSLHQMAKRFGVLTREGHNKEEDHGASLTPDQKAFWQDMIQLLEGIREAEPAFLDGLRAEIPAFLADTEKVKHALRVAYRKQPSMATLVLGSLSSDQSKVVKELAEEIEMGFGQTVSIWGLRNALNKLADDGKIEKSKGKVTTYRRLIENEITSTD